MLEHWIDRDIAMSSPADDLGRDKRIPRRVYVNVGERVAEKWIGIIYYYEPSPPSLSTVKLSPMVSLQLCRTIEPMPYYTNV